MAWIAKNDPSWDKYLEQQERINDMRYDDGPPDDPQSHAAKCGDIEALKYELDQLFASAQEISFFADVLKASINDLRNGLERNATPRPGEPPVAEDIGSGSLRVPASVWGERDSPPTPF